MNTMGPFSSSGLHAHHQLVLCVVEEFSEFLESVRRRGEVRTSVLHPPRQIVGQNAVLHLQAMRFQHVAQLRQSFFRLRRGTLGLRSAFALDDVAPALSRSR